MSTVKLIDKGKLKEIVLENPPLNVLGSSELQSIQSIYEELAKDSETSLVVFRSGIPKIFSFGLDPQELLKKDIKGRVEVFRLIGSSMAAMAESGIPTITDCTGPALAGGAVVTMMGDFIIAQKECFKISFSETKIRIPAPRFVWKIAERHIPAKYLPEVVALGRNINKKISEEYRALHGLYESEEEKNKLIEFYFSRFERLAIKPIRYTLREGKRELIESLRDLEQNADDLSPFLGEEFLEAGLKSLSK